MSLPQKLIIFFLIAGVCSGWPDFSVPVAAGMRTPEPVAFTQQNLDGDPAPEVSHWLARSGDKVFKITVYDGENDMPAASSWEGATDFQNDIWLFDYQADGSSELIVMFQATRNHKVQARIWDDQDTSGAVEYSSAGANLQVLESPYPTLVVEAPDDWTSANGNLTMNLTFLYDGPATSFGFDPGGDLHKYFLIDGAPDFRVRIVDHDNDGIADYEHSQVLADVPLTFGISRNGMKVNSGQNQPKRTLLSLYWPPLGLLDDFSGSNYFDLQPLIAVDWSKSKIKDFGILGYPAENGYHINDLNPWTRGQLNPVDFENAMAYYDLAANQDGLPELHIRHVYWPVGDLIWRPNPFLPVNEVVYSWRVNGSAPLEWDYKLSLAGTNPITTRVSFADFDLQILPYETLPAWVIGRPWANQTFIVPETGNYVSSEGLYEWSTTEGVIVDITKSSQVVPGSISAQRQCLSGAGPCDLSRFYTAIAAGLRGEYRFSSPAPVSLYLSPLDGRLHLTGAQGGVFNLGSGDLLRFHNLDGNDFIDGWTLERQPADPGRSSQVQSGLFRLADRYLLFDGERVQLVTSSASESLFTIPPPTTPVAWQDFRQRLSTAYPKDPRRISSWLAGLEIGLLQVTGAQVSSPVYRNGRYTFELTLRPNFRVAGRDELGLLGRPAGRYQVTYTGGRFILASLTPPRLSLSLTARPPDPLGTAPFYRLDLAAVNLGAQDSPELQLLVQAFCGLTPIDLLRTTTAVPGGGQVSWPLLWQPLDRPCQLTANLTGPDGRVVALAEAALPPGDRPAAAVTQVLQVSTRSFQTLLAFGLLILLLPLAVWASSLAGIAGRGAGP